MTITSLPQRPSDDSARVVVMAPPPGRMHWLLLMASLFVFGWLYVRTASNMISQNLESDTAATKALLAKIQKAESELNFSGPVTLTEQFNHWVPHEASGSIQPLWPWMAAQFAAKGWKLAPSEIEAKRISSAGENAKVILEHAPEFQGGLALNLVFSLTFLVIAGLLSSRLLGLLGALNFTVLAGFGVLLPRAVYFTPDAVYFCLFFLCFVCALELLKCNSAWLHVLFGGACGLAWLTNTSVLLLLACWLFVTAVRWLCTLFLNDDDKPWNCRKQFVGLLGFCFAFAAVIGPNLEQNKILHGSYFHAFERDWLGKDAPSPISNASSIVGTGLSNSGLEHLPEAEVSKETPDKSGFQLRADANTKAWNFFFKPHETESRGELAWQRLIDHLPFGLGAAGLVLLIALAYAASRRRAWFSDPHTTPKNGAVLTLFVLITFAAHALLLQSHESINGDGNPLSLLFAPLLFCIFWAAQALQTWADRRGHGGRVFLVAYTFAQVALLAVLCFQLYQIHGTAQSPPQLHF